MTDTMERQGTEPVLPIGSVVRLHPQGGLAMIAGRAALSRQNGRQGYFDYVAVPYPDGVPEPDEYLFFNREDVYEVEYFGYINADEQVFAENYDDLIAKAGYPKLSIPQDRQ